MELLNFTFISLMKKVSSNLKRGSRSISNILSSFGSVKETNLSAMLGYLINLNPIVAEKLFQITEPIHSIELELRSDHGEDRYDIVIACIRKKYVVEVKIDTHSPDQLRRYDKTHKNLFSIGRRLQSHLIEKRYHKSFLDWEEVCEKLNEAKFKGKKADQFYNKLVDDFCLHLRENNMIKGSYEDVYTRDLSGDTVEMYFNQRIYHCQTRFYEKAKNARYFAPYLTGSNARGESQSVFKSLGVGISFVSKINSTMLVAERELSSVLVGLKYSRVDIKQIFEKFGWKANSNREHAVLFLGEPLRLFQRPVTKQDLWGKATGAMPAMSIDFGDLIAASNGLIPLSQKRRK